MYSGTRLSHAWGHRSDDPKDHGVFAFFFLRFKYGPPIIVLAGVALLAIGAGVTHHLATGIVGAVLVVIGAAGGAARKRRGAAAGSPVDAPRVMGRPAGSAGGPRADGKADAEPTSRWAGFARWCFRHRKLVLLLWLVALVLAAGIAKHVGSTYSTNFSFPSTDSGTASNIVSANFPSQAGDSDQIVVQAKTGTLATPQVEAAVNTMLVKVGKLDFVTAVSSPYRTGLVSKDGTIGLATVQLDAQAQNISTAQAQRLIQAAQAVDPRLLNVQLGGDAVENGETTSSSRGFIVGALLALIVLFFAFRWSFLSAILPLLTAVVAIGIGTSLIAILSHAFSVPQFASQLAELISLGVGVDYALFIMNRHRRELLAGRSPEQAAVRALDTSGRAVGVAGLTVCIALLGMLALGLTFLYGVSLGAAFVVLLTMLSSLTLLPAMLGFYGGKALGRRDRRALHGAAAQGPAAPAEGRFWSWWALVVERRPAILSVASVAIIVVIALPFFGIRLGLADSGEDPPASTTRLAYDLLAQGFGPGFNGPLEIVGAINGPGDLARFDGFVADLQHTSGVARVLRTQTSPNGKAAVAVVYPGYSPQAPQTTALVDHIRSEVPKATAGTSLAIHVGGETAAGIDFSDVLAGKIPLFLVVIVVLAFLLLVLVFRSLLVPLMASAMNILSIGAALGATVAAFQYGWLRPVLGFAEAGPIEVYLPLLMFAILFGLSMDYEVFLVSRMHEEWIATGDNRRAVTRGQADTGRVITAAGLIMILVYLAASFINKSLVIEEVGIGFAVAIIIDAFVVRTVLVPSLMHLFGRRNWWIPARLDRWLPTIHIEGEPATGEPLPGASTTAAARPELP
jgi:putative drug exporter of the RND superfamily